MSNPRVPSFSVAGFGVNLYLVAGVGVLGAAHAAVGVGACARCPLGIAYPFMALCFIIVPALGFLVLGEPVTWKTFAGSALIVAGVVIIST